MKKNLLLTAILAITCLTIQAKTIFVKVGTTGNGTSWEDATGDLLAALFAAQSGDEVWVSRGIYYPANDGDRTVTFTIPDGVKVLGGFIGNETSADQRNPQKNMTRLSGDIGVEGDASDNAYSVITIENAGQNTLLDGFIIEGGVASSDGETGSPQRSGGGLYLKNASPVIANCIIRNNYARDGGAVYNNGIGAACNPEFINCTFLTNRADLDGGAVFNDGRRGGNASPRFEKCQFVQNEGNYGGAMCNYGGKGKSNPVLIECTFKGNEAYLRGGGLFNMDVAGIAEPVLTHCQFVANKAVAGEAVYTFSAPENNEPQGLVTNTAYKAN